MADIQIRSVDKEMAQAAKERAAATHRTLSDYVKDLIESDLEAQRTRTRMQALLAEIEAADHKPVDLADTAAALATARDELGIG